MIFLLCKFDDDLWMKLMKKINNARIPEKDGISDNEKIK